MWVLFGSFFRVPQLHLVDFTKQQQKLRCMSKNWIGIWISLDLVMVNEGVCLMISGLKVWGRDYIRLQCAQDVDTILGTIINK
jgi:hypothetical protein